MDADRQSIKIILNIEWGMSLEPEDSETRRLWEPGVEVEQTAEELVLQRQQILSILKHRYEVSGNPLLVWEAISHSLDPQSAPGEPIIPDWCLPALRDAASNLFALTAGKDFRKAKGDPARNIGPDIAIELVAEALALSSKGRRNSFSAIVKDNMDIVDALGVHYTHSKFLKEKTIEYLSKRRNIGIDWVKRIMARGLRLRGTSGET